MSVNIAENIAAVRATIAAACERTGRNPAEITLIAVSKTHPYEAVLEAAAAGVQHFGENRVEEAEGKISRVRAATQEPLTWHMIGHLQSRKARDASALFGIIHSVDTLKLAEKLARMAHEEGQLLPIFLEMNVSGEASKYGFSAAGWQMDHNIRQTIFREIDTLMKWDGIQVRGLMTMAPVVETMEAARPIFAELARLRAALQEHTGKSLPDLSMGMTDDYPVAIEEGATLIRVGRAIFGSRLQQA
jgi:pyridoxal phosphate enzyme (YggS family)